MRTIAGDGDECESERSRCDGLLGRGFFGKRATPQDCRPPRGRRRPAWRRADRPQTRRYRGSPGAECLPYAHSPLHPFPRSLLPPPSFPRRSSRSHRRPRLPVEPSPSRRRQSTPPAGVGTRFATSSSPDHRPAPCPAQASRKRSEEHERRTLAAAYRHSRQIFPSSTDNDRSSRISLRRTVLASHETASPNAHGVARAAPNRQPQRSHIPPLALWEEFQR